MQQSRWYKKISVVLGSIALVGTLALPLHALLVSYDSATFSIYNPIIPNGGGISNSSTYGVLQSIGQGVVGKSASSNFQVWSGFQYFATVGSMTLTGAATTSTAALSWNVLDTHNGAKVDHYEVGVGTISGSYVFETAGSNTTFTKSGLSADTPYYFIVKAVSPTGVTLAFSNELALSTTGTPDGGGGGGSSGGSTGTAAVVVSGLASPGANVVIVKDGVIAAVVVADPAAAFKVTISNLAATQYVFAVYAEDNNKVRTSSYTFPITLTNSVTADIANVFLAPSIGVTNSVVKQGEPIGIFGTTVPGAQVTISVHSAQEFVEKVTAATSGAWFKQFDTSFLEIGDHSTYSRAVKADRVTAQSAVVPFVVGTQSVLNTTGYKRSDLNKDGKVNVADLSILLYYWNKIPTVKVLADINKDGKVGVIDLSILLYDWTG